MGKKLKADAAEPDAPDIQRRRLLLRSGLGAAAAYLAPLVFRIEDRAEAKGSKRFKGPSKRRGSFRRFRGSRRPKGSKRRRFF